ALLAITGVSAVEGRGSTPRIAPQSPGGLLEMDIPSRSFALLREGSVGPMRWALYAYRGRVKKPWRTPCLHLRTLTRSPARGQGFHDDNGCAPVGITSSAPILAEGGGSDQRRPGGPLITQSTVAIGVAPTIATLKIKLQKGPERELHTSVLTTHQARKARVNP